MRISSQTFFMRNTSSMMEQQASLSEKNLHLSSTKRVMNGSDDPVAIATIQRLKQDLSIGEQYISNGETAQSANELSDTALTQSTYILQRVRELMVSGSNGTLNESDRNAVAIELESLRDELMGVANTKDGNNQFIYAGYEVDTQPFQKNEFGEIEYHGDSGENDYRIGAGVLVQANDSGSKIFMEVAEGNGIFVSELNANNTGAGVISSGNIIDENAARDFLDQDYTIAINDTGTGPEYSVYGLKETTVSGSANISISSVDLDAADINSVDPAINGPVTINFIETGTSTNQFQIEVNGQLSSSIYDGNNAEAQTLNINGIAIEVDGLPKNGDSFQFTQFVAPTPYEEDQAISFNGIKTQVKGEVEDGDTFTLRQSEEKDIFATIQSAIEALRIPGTDQTAEAQRNTAFSMSLLQIDGALDNVTGTQSSVGARLRTIDNQYESTLDFNLTIQRTLSNLEDLDMAAAISEYQQEYSMLEVSQQTFVQLQQLSLFNLI
ncbi:flagellar hook-associated protein FlgL [Psychromonas sp. SP041]|uniref:flagellar hook-associated protein FlgL n=1 Tax=Psychromonas sp. SP041 TaxID=1365007 RepID=UPI0004722C30|nr:flagellar hook-associated protein FlgL [Psychromonas sp. SP041]